MKNVISFRSILSAVILAGLVAGNPPLGNSIAQTQPASPAPDAVSPDNAPASNLPPEIAPGSPLAQIVQLVQAGLEQSVILNYINNSTNFFNLDTDKIIYLNDLGVPTEIINAMMQHDQRLEQTGVAPPQPAQPTSSVAPMETTAQPAEVTVNYFYNTLAPYGTWVDIAGYGWCWRPTVVIYDTGWQPYFNNGHWVYTDHGWFWVSGYSWGWATFHYGRWFRIPRYGWCWWPDTTWAPSWVCWRYDRDYCGWAPLPPRAIYRSGIGLFYNGHKVSAGFSFGLSVGDFTFVATRNFYGRQPWHHRIGEKEAARIYHRTRVFHKMDFDRRDHAIVNSGIPPHDITAVTKQPIHRVAVHYETGGMVRGKRHEEFDHGGRTLIVKRPRFVGSPVLTLYRGGTPTTEHRQNVIHPTVHGNANSAFQQRSNPAQNNYQRHDLNQNPRLNDNRGRVRSPQTRPTYPPRQNESHPNVYKNNNGASTRLWNSDRNNFQHREANPSPSPNFNRANPQAPQHRQSEVPHVITPAPQQPNHTIGAPYSTQNRPMHRNYNSRNRVLSPRARGFEQQSPHAVFRTSPQQNTTVNARREQHSSAPTRHFSPASGQRQNQYHNNTPRNESRNNVQDSNRSERPQHTVEPQAPNRSPSSSHQSRDQGGDNSRRGH